MKTRVWVAVHSAFLGAPTAVLLLHIHQVEVPGALIVGLLAAWLCYLGSVALSILVGRPLPWAPTVLKGYAWGMVATALYNCIRLPGVFLGVLPDVPKVLGFVLAPSAWPSPVAGAMGYGIHFGMTGSGWGAMFYLWRKELRSEWSWPLPGVLFGLAIGILFLFSPASLLARVVDGGMLSGSFLSWVLVSHAVYGIGLELPWIGSSRQAVRRPAVRFRTAGTAIAGDDRAGQVVAGVDRVDAGDEPQHHGEPEVAPV